MQGRLSVLCSHPWGGPRGRRFCLHSRMLHPSGLSVSANAFGIACRHRCSFGTETALSKHALSQGTQMLPMQALLNPPDCTVCLYHAWDHPEQTGCLERSRLLRVETAPSKLQDTRTFHEKHKQLCPWSHLASEVGPRKISWSLASPSSQLASPVGVQFLSETAEMRDTAGLATGRSCPPSHYFFKKLII